MDLFNDEHYADPTPKQAISLIQAQKETANKYRPLAYICSPFSGNVLENIKNARRYSRFAFEQGYIFFHSFLMMRSQRKGLWDCILAMC